MDNTPSIPPVQPTTTMDLVLCGRSIFDEKEFSLINDNKELKNLFHTVARQVDIGFHLDTQRMLFHILENSQKDQEVHAVIYKLLLFSYLTAGFHYYKNLQRDLCVRALTNIHKLLGLDVTCLNWFFPPMGLKKIKRSDEGTQRIVTVAFFLLSCLYLKKGDTNQAYYYRSVLDEMPGPEAKQFFHELQKSGEIAPPF